MATKEITDEIVVENTGEGAEEKPKEESKPKNADQWLGNVRNALEAVLPPDRMREMEQVLAFAKAARDAQQSEQKAPGQDIRAFFEELDVAEIEKLLKQLEELPQEVAKKAPEEVVLYKRELEEVKTEARRRHVESGSVAAATKGSLEQQVFENFSKYLEEGATITYGGDRLEVHRTSDGALIITVPSPSFENMLALAGELGNLHEHYSNDPEKYADMLMTAAAIMDQQSIYSESAIVALYNAGFKLRQVVSQAKATGNPATLEEIQRWAREQVGKPGWTERIKDAYLRIFLGKHEINEFTTDQDGILHIRKEGQGKLYDVLFDQWQKSQEGKEWLRKNKSLLDTLYDSSTREQITKAYDTWLYEGKRDNGKLVREDLLKRMKGFMEQKVDATGSEDKRYELLFSKWRHMLTDSDGVKKIQKQIDEQIGQKAVSNRERLEIISKLFQPNAKVPPDALQYIPADVLKIFQNTESTQQQRSEAACIIADSYVKIILQERGFGVYTQLLTTERGGHTRLIAVSKTDGKSYFVDPNKPDEAIEEIAETTEENRKLLQSLRSFKTINGQRVVELEHGVLLQSKGSVIADGNALLTSGFLTNMIDVVEPPLPVDVKFAAAQRATALSPDNPVAWLQMAKYSTGNKQKEYFERAVNLGFDRNTAERLLQKDKKIQIGDWRDAAGNPVTSADPQIQSLIDQANAWIRAAAVARGVNPTTAGLEVLPQIQLKTVDTLFENLSRNPTIAGNANLLLETNVRLAEINQEMVKRQLEARGDEIQAFYLTSREKEIFTERGPDEIRQLIEREILKFSRDLDPGTAVPQQTTQQMEIRFRDMITVLSARTPDTTVLTPAQKQEQLDYLVAMGKALQGAPTLATYIESSDPELQKNAIRTANFMDERGGLTVLDQLYKMHDGRAGGLVSDLRQDMRRLLQKNFEKDGKFYTLHEEYKDLPRQIVERVYQNAIDGIGAYSSITKPDLNNPPNRIPLTHAEIREQIEMDIKFAQLLFIATGEASAIYIRSRNPDAVRDLSAGAFLNAQIQDVKRYEIFTDSNKRVAKAQYEYGSRYHLEETYGEHMAKELEKEKDLFDFYVEQNGIDILAPTVQMWWENRAVRTWQMIESLNQYERQYVERWLADPAHHGTNPPWFPVGRAYQGPSKETIRDKRIRDAGNDKEKLKNAHESYEVPIGGDPEFGIMLRAFLYQGSVSKEWSESERILQGKGADYYADVIFEPFAYQAGLHNRVDNAPADRRFMAVFNGDSAAFLDGFNPPRYSYKEGANTAKSSDAYRLAMRRFDKFQQILRPAMDALRNQRINGTEPSQTNFSQADAGVDQMLNALGIGNHADFRGLIAAMQNQISGEHGMAHALVYDPVFENHWYSPMTVIDMPMWMIDGKDLAGNINGRDLRSQMGGSNILGRYLGDVQELGWKTRAGVISFIKNNPNNTHGFIKLMEEQIVPGIENTRGNENAHDVEFMMMTKYLLMMHPEVADWFGLAGSHAGKNTEYRQIYGSKINALTREQILAFAEANFIPKLPEKLKRVMRRRLRIRGWDRFARKSSQSLFIFLLSTIFATGTAVFGAVNPADQAA